MSLNNIIGEIGFSVSVGKGIFVNVVIISVAFGWTNAGVVCSGKFDWIGGSICEVSNKSTWWLLNFWL